MQKFRNLMGRIEIRVLLFLASGVFLICLALAVAQFPKSSSEFDPPTISSWDDLIKEYLIFRAHSYPLVAPDGYLQSGQTEEALQEYDFEELQKGPHWYWHFDGGVFYFDDNSPLAKLVNDGERVLIYEDLAQEELLVLSMPEKEGEQPREEIVYDSPAWPEVREDKNDDLWRELSKRRIAWQVKLKSKSLAEKELAGTAATPVTLLKDSESGGMRMMRMEETSNHLWLSIQGPAQGMTNIEVAVHIPEGFTNRIEIFTCTNLLDFWWTLASTNLSTEGMNIVCWTDNPPKEADCCYYAAGNADVDSDVDGLTDAREKFLYHTSPTNADTDGDGANDGDEVNHGTNPLNHPGDADTDGLSDDLEIVLGTNPNAADSDLDWAGDAYEVEMGTDPLNASNTPPLLLEIDNNALYTRTTNVFIHFPGLVGEHAIIGETEDLTNGIVQDMATNITYGMQSELNINRQVYARLYRNTVEQSPLISGSIIFDNIVPTIGDFSPANGSATNSRWIKISGAVTDAVSAVRVFVNGQWADGVSQGRFQYDRFMLERGTNRIEITGEDMAGNMATQHLEVIQDITGDTTAPTIALDLPRDYVINGGVTNCLNQTTFGTNETLYVRGTTDDETADVRFTIVAEDETNGPYSAIVTETQVWGLVQLYPGTNVLMALASDAAGNASTGVYTVIRNTNFVFEITYPGAYEVMNSASTIVSGIASPQFLMATITVNGVAAEIVDHGSNISYATISPVPLAVGRTELIAEAQLNGHSYHADPMVVGYEVSTWSSAESCGVADWWYYGDRLAMEGVIHQTWDWSWTSASCLLRYQETQYKHWIHYYVEGGSWVEHEEEETSSTTRVESSPMSLRTGRWDEETHNSWWRWHVQLTYSGEVQYVKRSSTQEVQTVVFQFTDFDYGKPPDTTTDPSLITFRGQTGFWYNGKVSFILPIRTEVEYTISETDFHWPLYSYHASPSGGFNFDYWGQWLSFQSFSNDVIRVDTIDATSPKSGTSANPPPFAGHTSWPFDVTHSPNPDKHMVVFYKDTVDSSFNVGDFDVTLKANILPTSITADQLSEVWSKISGPASGSLNQTDTFEVKYQNPKVGGVYRFDFDLGLSGCAKSEANVVLPLAGAEVDSIVSADIGRANTFATTVLASYSWFQRQRPANGRRWFIDNGAGDYLGRPDNASTPTVWVYNQVNTSSSFGMGAVGTWKGKPVRVAKISNFMVGYAARKIGVNSVSAWISQVIGTWNDSAASKSWDAGWDIAGGASYDTTVTALVADIWDDADDKNQKLWPNTSATGNYVVPNSFYDPDHQFTSPGFLYMTSP